MHQPQTIRILTVTLIAGSHIEDPTAPFSQTCSRWKSGIFGRRRRRAATLSLSHGRSCSLRVRPIGSSKAVRALLLRPLTLDSLARRKVSSPFRPPRQFSVLQAAPENTPVACLPPALHRFSERKKCRKETAKETQEIEICRRKQSQEVDAGSRQALTPSARLQPAENARDEHAVPRGHGAETVVTLNFIQSRDAVWSP